MPKLRIDNKEVEVDQGATILDAARQVGIEIPTLCYLEGHAAPTSCLVCVVKVNGSSRFVPACATRAEHGMKVESETDEVRQARKVALELLLGDHVGDCVGPCVSVCPAHMDIPTMISQITEGKMRDAIVTVKQRIALPAVLGRICPEICEKGCRRGVKDAPVSICKLKRYVADTDLASGDLYVPECKEPTGKKVAIVGSGPAGLAAAYYLQQEGHACTVFDDHPEPGGMLRYGVPVERLPRWVLDSEIEIIKQLGAEFWLGTRIESIAELRRQSDAVILASGQLDEAAASTLGVPMSGRAVSADKHTMMTGTDGVFAAGSALAPSHFAVRAVASGRMAANAVSCYLAGTPFSVDDRPYSVHIGKLAPSEIGEFTVRATEDGRVETESGLTQAEAETESNRCLHCECRSLVRCKLRRYAIEYGAKPALYKGERRQIGRDLTHPMVVYEPGKCVSCGLCVQIAEEAEEPLGLTFVGRGFGVVIAVPFNEKLTEGLRKVAEECVDACPTGALEMKENGNAQDSDT